MRTKQLSRYMGGSWQTPIDIGADAQNVDYSKVVGGSTVDTNVKDELDAINSNKLDTDGSSEDLTAGNVVADSSATIAAIGDIVNADNLDEIWGKFNRLKSLASAHELAQMSTASGVHGFRYYNNELSYYNGSAWVAIAAGHDIKNGSGTTMTKRDNLQFVNLVVTDDSINNKTIVKNPVYEFDTIAEMNEAVEEGDIEDGATIYVKQNAGTSGEVGFTVDEYGRVCLVYETND